MFYLATIKNKGGVFIQYRVTMDSASLWLTMVCEACIIFFSMSQLFGVLLIKYFNISVQNWTLLSKTTLHYIAAQYLCKICLTPDVLD